MSPSGRIWGPRLAAGGHPPAPRRILAIQTQRIGDVLCLTPLLTALRRRFPAARLAALVQPPADQLLAGNPDLDSVIAYDPRAMRRRPAAWAGLTRRLRVEQFDWAFSVHAASSVALALRAAGIPWRTCVWRYGGVKPPPWARLYTQAIVQERQRGEQHEISYNLDALRALGIEPQHEGVRVGVSPTAAAAATRILGAAGLVAGDRFAVLHPGHSGGRQEWPAEHYAALGDRLGGELGLAVALTGSPAEVPLCARVAAAMRGPALNLGGRLTLPQLVAVLARARLYVSVPTGPMHLAAALGTPVIALFGPRELMIDRQRFPPFDSAPFRPGRPEPLRHAEVLSATPCDCPRMRACVVPTCLREIHPDRVFAAARVLVAPTGARVTEREEIGV
jgi:ADP-heptose:LPS heptosyltransferase